ncbi:hypothetical protein PN466_17055 [Roseofilum reptotaenium CS-1145]|nr:hypothetical protein [Roseofilum reptotaenium]MDB9518657.1 hypothetical protein [Roseofilum reptotaenium CS-1145]
MIFAFGATFAMSDRHEPDSSKVKIAIAPSPLPITRTKRYNSWVS